MEFHQYDPFPRNRSRRFFETGNASKSLTTHRIKSGALTSNCRQAFQEFLLKYINTLARTMTDLFGAPCLNMPGGRAWQRKNKSKQTAETHRRARDQKPQKEK